MAETTLTKAEPSSVIIERVLIYEVSMQLLLVNFKKIMCLVIDAECSEGASKNPSGTVFPMNQQQWLQSMINHICLSYDYYQLTRSHLRQARMFLTTDYTNTTFPNVLHYQKSSPKCLLWVYEYYLAPLILSYNHLNHQIAISDVFLIIRYIKVES